MSEKRGYVRLISSDVRTCNLLALGLIRFGPCGVLSGLIVVF